MGKFYNYFLFLIFFTVFLIAENLFSQSQTYRLIEETDFQHKMGNPYGNALKNFDVLVDELRGRVYISPILNNTYPIIDANTDKEIGDVTMPYEMGGFNLINLSLNSYNGYILSRFNPEHEGDNLLRIVNPITSQQMGAYSYTQLISGLAVDTKRNQIYLGEGNKIKILNGDNLSKIDSITAQYSIGDLKIDSANQILYMVVRNVLAGNRISVTTYDLTKNNHPVLNVYEISSSVPLGKMFIDVGNSLLILVGQKLVKILRLTDCTELFTVSFPNGIANSVYSASKQRMFLMSETGYSADGEHGDWGKLMIYDIHTKKMDSIRLGMDPSQMGIYDKKGKLYITLMPVGDVQVIDINTLQSTFIDIGESLEDISLAPDKNSIYFADRLGDNTIVNYNLIGKSCQVINAGNWPVAVEIDSTLGRLFVMNHFESNVSVFSTLNNTLVKTIGLPGVAEARHDALSYMYSDESIHKVLVGIPECEVAAVIDSKKMSVDKIIKVDGYHWTEDEKAVGRLQVISAPNAGYLYILKTEARKLNIYNLNTYAFIDSINLQVMWNNKLTDFGGDLVAYDSIQKKLFVGPIIINTATNTVNQNNLPGGIRWLGYNYNKTLSYSLGIENGYLYVYEHHPKTLAVVASRKLYKHIYGTPVFYLDIYGKRLFIAEFSYALLKIYDLNTLVPTGTGTDQDFTYKEIKLSQNYPNPFNPCTTIEYSIPAKSHVTLTIYNSLGQIVEIPINYVQESGNYKIEWKPYNLPSGIYYSRILSGDYSKIIKMIYVK